MVATLIDLTNPDDALSYYEADEYYVGDAKAPSAWHGRGAAKLGLRGEVDPEAFAASLHGKLPDGTVLGTVRDGVREHKPGWDLTFSAPKSVSVAALVAGDRRLLDAHDRAVRVALDYAERHAATTRIREGKTTPRVATGNLAIAAFPHFTARETENLPDPQVHTHCVIINATCDDDGTWRSIESHPLYQLQKAIGAIYHQQLAAEVQRLGYAVTIGGENGLFELDAIAPEVRDAFANRSHQIEAALAARGQTRASATAAEKAVVALDTRSPKEAVDHQQLTGAWRDRAHELGFTEDVRRALVTEAEARAGQAMPGTPARMRIADREVAFAAAHVGERDAVFAAAILEREAGDAARGQVFPGDIVAAIARAERRQDLVIRAAPGMARGVVGYTTREAIATEERMLGLERAGRGTLDPLADHFDAANILARAEAVSARAGHTWTEGQRAATKALLLSTSSVVGIQGSAGTAKTTTVLRVHADAAKARGYAVRALAPTATAADELARAIGGEPMTVAKMLAAGPATPCGDGKPEIWIVDEASMLSARDGEALLAQAHAEGARVVLVGDVKQLGSVAAGRAFGQLQDAGMETPKLAEIVRQSNPDTKRAVEALLAGDAEAAFAALDNGGGEVIQHADHDVRRARLARDFARLSPKDRARTLVLDPTREGRQALTKAIRAELVRDGTLGERAMTVTVLESCGLTDAARARAASYRPGTVVIFRKGGEDGQPRRNTGYRVESVNAESGTVRLLDPEGKVLTWSPGDGSAANADAFAQVEQQFRTGDRIQFTRNNYEAKRLNGRTAEVVAIDPDEGILVVRSKNGKRQALDMANVADRHIRPGWVRTIHSAQGATCERVMAHLESFRSNVDANIAYVAVSRAKASAIIYTDDRDHLARAIEGRSSAKVGAIDETLMRKGATIAAPVPVRTAGIAIGL